MGKILKGAAHKLAAVACAVGIAGGALTAPAAQAAAPAIAIQGHKTTTANGATCTIGYVEPDRAWTAAHCGFNGQAIYNEFGSHIGTLRYFWPSGTAERDLAYIQFAHGTVAGGNPISGDGIRPVPEPGGIICATGRHTPETCSAVTPRRARPGMVSAQLMHKISGDSGSGVYIPGQPGVVGIFSGETLKNFGADAGTYSNFALMPSPHEIATLPHQGRVSRHPDLPVSVNTGNLAEHGLRYVGEPMEAFSSTSSRGLLIDDIRGFIGTFGIFL
ncbi:hypothetical protein [Corynebacterium phocae]|uniref:hypothetical protein n=1 Tax=Corynebacterium phocae TaxID=161895 RepID=UPI0009511302|nr:hypothetical protein [Corynebacterium phocae]KAA8724186.1 hypothetical protein F4V58_06215 [Corynebacterium phocae]